MKLPNGYGSVKKLPGNRNNPYMACEGKTGKQKPIGYTKTKEAALALLAQYNENPWDLEAAKITLQELFDLWVKKRGVKLGALNFKSLKSAYIHIKKLADQPYKTIKAYQMQDCIDTCGRKYSTQSAIKNLWGHLDRFALELDIVKTQYSTLLKSAPIDAKDKTPFSEDEIARLWQNADTPWVDSILFLIYTGYRISEMLNLTLDKVNLEDWTLHGGAKTKAGKMRVVPIHHKIKDIVARRYAVSTHGFLFEFNDAALYYQKYEYRFWTPIMAKLGMQHTIHETRHTFRSRLDSAGANQVCIDRMMGHVSEGTGKKVYTHKDIEELRFNIELVAN